MERNADDMQLPLLFVQLTYEIYALCAQSLQSCPTLCNPIDCSPADFSVHGVLQARILEWVAMPPPGDLPNSGIKSASPALLCCWWILYC